MAFVEYEVYEVLNDLELPRLGPDPDEALADVCDSQIAATGAPPFSPNDRGPHRIAVFESGYTPDGFGYFRTPMHTDDAAAAEWLASDLESTELVACIGIEHVGDDQCSYSGGHTLFLTREVAEIRLYEANTAALIDSTELEGPDADCPASREFTAATDTRSGGAIPDRDFIAWLRQYVDP